MNWYTDENGWGQRNQLFEFCLNSAWRIKKRIWEEVGCPDVGGLGIYQRKARALDRNMCKHSLKPSRDVSPQWHPCAELAWGRNRGPQEQTLACPLTMKDGQQRMLLELTGVKRHLDCKIEKTHLIIVDFFMTEDVLCLEPIVLFLQANSLPV